MLSLWIIIFFSISEIAILVAILFFFTRLKRSEQLMQTLQDNQDSLLERLQLNAQLERELVATFAQRQAELRNLDEKLEERAQTLRTLLEEADNVSRSPRFLREVISEGGSKGFTARQIAQRTGLSEDEVELILEQNAKQS